MSDLYHILKLRLLKNDRVHIVLISTAGSSLAGGTVAGIVVGVLVFITCAVIGVVLAIILTYFKCRHTRYFVKVEHKGIENPNYGDVDHGTHSQKLQTSVAVAVDYETPVSIISEQKQLQPGKPTQQYINIPAQNPTGSIDNSGASSYVLVRHQQHQRVCPQRSYDSQFLLSSEEWDDLPTVIAAESGDPTSGKLTTTYSLLVAD